MSGPYSVEPHGDGWAELERIADDLQTLVDTQASRIATQAARIAALEAALREIDEECPRGYTVPFARQCFDSIIVIVAAALAPAPAPEEE